MKNILRLTAILFCVTAVLASSYPRVIFCPIHRKDAYFQRQVGFGRTQSCYYMHSEYVNGQNVGHTLVTDCE